MSEYLKTSELTESRSFIQSFVKEIVVEPGKAAVRYSHPHADTCANGYSDANTPSNGYSHADTSANRYPDT